MTNEFKRYVIYLLVFLFLKAKGTIECPIYQHGHSVRYYEDFKNVLTESTGTVGVSVPIGFHLDQELNIYFQFQTDDGITLTKLSPDG